MPDAFASAISVTHKIISVVKSGMKVDMDALRPGSKELRTLLEGFAPISNRFQIYTLCDTVDTDVPFVGGIFCDSMNYYMGLPNEELVHLDARYSDMIKLRSRQSMDYQKVLAILQSSSRQHGLIPHSDNWQFNQLFRLDGLER